MLNSFHLNHGPGEKKSLKSSNVRKQEEGLWVGRQERWALLWMAESTPSLQNRKVPEVRDLSICAGGKLTLARAHKHANNTDCADCADLCVKTLILCVNAGASARHPRCAVWRQEASVNDRVRAQQDLRRHWVMKSHACIAVADRHVRLHLAPRCRRRGGCPRLSVVRKQNSMCRRGCVAAFGVYGCLRALGAGTCAECGRNQVS